VTGPLDGFRLVDLTQGLGGPYAWPTLAWT
jgi:crotonobetainyl-CoA:carnitine CoA-transferase CaiB-like acyl-CoA transferase